MQPCQHMETFNLDSYMFDWLQDEARSDYSVLETITNPFGLSVILFPPLIQKPVCYPSIT